jgi:glutamate-1-semialdehyde 2,1-aminomutase
MRLCNQLNASDLDLVKARIDDFLPAQIYDLHAHLVTPDPRSAPYLRDETLGCAEYLAMLGQWMPGRTVNALFFGFPACGNDREGINGWMMSELSGEMDRDTDRALILVSPDDNPARIQNLLSEEPFVGLKPYHFYAPIGDSAQARIEDFAPEWMWDVCNASDGVLMLHIMRDRAIADPDNIKSIYRLCRRYPRARVVLAHIGRSFSYRMAREGLRTISDFDNVWVDTSAVTESETFRWAIEVLGPKRIAFGTDFPICQLRGRCIAVGGSSFRWIHPEENPSSSASNANGQMTLVGIESLLCLREAVEDSGLGTAEIADIFLNNSLEILSPHLPSSSGEIGR